MDRRAFLKTGAGVAAAVAASGDVATAEGSPSAELATPALASGCRELSVAISGELQADAATRLARRLEMATSGRFRLRIAATEASPLEAVSAGSADLYLSSELPHQDLEPALAYFTGLPASVGLPPPRHHAWLMVGGGQMLWDDLGSTLGIKPLLAGYTGPPGLWLAKIASGRDRLDGLHLHALGFAANVVRRLGGEVLRLPPAELAAGLADGRLDGAEGLGTLLDLALGLPGTARHYVEPGIVDASALCFGVRCNIWRELSAGDQAVFEACAAEQVRLSLAEMLVEGPIARSVLMARYGVVVAELPHPLAAAFSMAGREELGRVAETSIRARRIDASYRAFLELTGEATS